MQSCAAKRMKSQDATLPLYKGVLRLVGNFEVRLQDGRVNQQSGQEESSSQTSTQPQVYDGKGAFSMMRDKRLSRAYMRVGIPGQGRYPAERTGDEFFKHLE